MNILVAGMGRSGTELLIGIFNHIGKHKNLKIKAIKSHYILKKFVKWSDRTCSTKRDFRESIASTKRYIGKTYNENKSPRRHNITEECASKLKHYYICDEYSEFEFIYELFLTNKEAYIKQVFKFLNIKPSKKDVDYIVQVIKKPFKNKTHITNKDRKLITFKDTLHKKEISRIYKFFESKSDDIKNKFLYVEKYDN